MQPFKGRTPQTKKTKKNKKHKIKLKTHDKPAMIENKWFRMMWRWEKKKNQPQSQEKQNEKQESASYFQLSFALADL